MTETVLVTGGGGYIGALACQELQASGRRVRAIDSLLHGQTDVVARLRSDGVEVLEGDVRDADLRRTALAGADAVVHLAAIVGDPACARDPETAKAVNVEATRGLLDDALVAGVGRLIFASTCSNYGRLDDPTVAVGEDAELSPVSLYAEQKVAIEQLLLSGAFAALNPTCVRFATVYGAAPRMRFDLTVNEFTRDLWFDRDLEVFGEQFWRPYIHVRDAGRAIRAILDAPIADTSHQVFNAGRSGENYRKLDLIDEIRKQIASGRVTYVSRSEDPRDYQVSFDKIRARLGFETLMTVPDGIAEVVGGLRDGAFGDPFADRTRN